MNVYLRGRTDLHTAQTWCSYSAASVQPGATLDSTFTFAAGPFAGMAEAQAWIASQGVALGQEWSC